MRNEVRDVRDDYVDNKEFYEEMIAFIKKRKKDKKFPVPNCVGKKILLLVQRYSRFYKFCNYTYRDKLICDAVETCIRYAGNFDPLKSNNPFAYFTRIAWSSFLKSIQEEKKNTKIKKVLFDDLMERNIQDYNLQDNTNKGDLDWISGVDKPADFEPSWQPIHYVNKEKGIDMTFYNQKDYDHFVKLRLIEKQRQKDKELLKKS